MSGVKPVPFVILASGEGSNARVLLEHARKNSDRLEARAVISDRSGVPVLEMAARMGCETFVVAHKEESMMLALLKRLEPRWALLAGYKRIVPGSFLDFFADETFHRVLNIHPSLLPAYPGLNAYERAYADGVRLSGVTVHFVDTGLDTGPCILQQSFDRKNGDSLESFKEKGRKIEHQLYPKALDLAAAGKLRLAKGERWVR